MAPEIIRGIKYTNKIDIWSLGCILYEICTLKRCFDANNILNLAKKIISGVHGKIDLNFYNDSLQNIIDLALKIDDKQRPNIEEVYKLVTKKITLGEFKKLCAPDDFGYKIQKSELPLLNKQRDSNTSWYDYINNALLNKKYNGHIYNNILIEAAIVGFDGTIWACTKGLLLKKEEVENLKKIIFNKANSINSFIIDNKKYEITVYNKGFSFNFILGDNIGGTIAKTNLALIIGIYDKNKMYIIDGEKKNQNSGLCKMVVEDLANVLIPLHF